MILIKLLDALGQGVTNLRPRTRFVWRTAAMYVSFIAGESSRDGDAEERHGVDVAGKLVARTDDRAESCSG